MQIACIHTHALSISDMAAPESGERTLIRGTFEALVGQHDCADDDLSEVGRAASAVQTIR